MRSVPGLAIVRGAGDIATGVILRFARAGFRVLALECAAPSAIRRTVALSEAVYDGSAVVEGLRATLERDADGALAAIGRGEVPIMVDPDMHTLAELGPSVLIDAIIAKRNLGTHPGLAPVVIALGPGFRAPRDAHAVIETARGHYLGRAIYSGEAMPNTGVPGEIGGKGAERVVYSETAGFARPLAAIGSRVDEGDPILELTDASGEAASIARARCAGVVRGLIRPGFFASAGYKVADVDPRAEPRHCLSVSDKALAIAGGALEAALALGARPEAEHPQSRPGRKAP
jgi:xanthine dehydrogenase accessory factor